MIFHFSKFLIHLNSAFHIRIPSNLAFIVRPKTLKHRIQGFSMLAQFLKIIGYIHVELGPFLCISRRHRLKNFKGFLVEKQGICIITKSVVSIADIVEGYDDFERFGVLIPLDFILHDPLLAEY